MKKQFIYPEILVHDLRKRNPLTIDTTWASKVNDKYDGSGQLAPTRPGELPDAPQDNSNWQDLSGFQNGNSGW